MKIPDCEFCDELQREYVLNKARKKRQDGKAMHCELSVMLATSMYTDKDHEFLGRVASGTYKLHRCPICGADIRKRFRQWGANE